MLAAILRAAEERLGIQPITSRKPDVQIPLQLINGKYIVNHDKPGLANGLQLINGKKQSANQDTP
jgi:hypothetical protein